MGDDNQRVKDATALERGGMSDRILAAVMALCVAWLAGPGDARSVAQTLRQTGLTQADINLMTQTAATLYQSGAPKVGRTVSWTNADTQAKGSVKLVAFRGDCAYLQHFIITVRRPTSQEFRFKQCRQSDGSWVLTP